METYHKYTVLEAHLSSLRQEIQELEKVEKMYHSRGELIQIQVVKAPITLYNEKKIIEELHHNNWENEEAIVNVISNTVRGIETIADRDEYQRDFIHEISSKEACETLRQ